MPSVRIDYEGFTLTDLVRAARFREPVEATPEALARIAETRLLVDRWVTEGRTIYGITTGFGSAQQRDHQRRGYPETPAEHPAEPTRPAWAGTWTRNRPGPCWCCASRTWPGGIPASGR